MMKSLFCTIVSLFLLFACNAGAIGLGVYTTGGGGQNIDSEKDFTDLGLGLVLDTAVEKDTLFNYRLSIGYNNQSHNEGGTIDQCIMDNAFGFGILRNDHVRLWLGPDLTLSASENPRGDMFYGVGIGPVIGVNVHLSDLLSLSFSVNASYSYLDSDNSHIDSWNEWKVGGNLALLFKIGDKYSK